MAAVQDAHGVPAVKGDTKLQAHSTAGMQQVGSTWKVLMCRAKTWDCAPVKVQCTDSARSLTVCVSLSITLSRQWHTVHG